MVKCWLFGHKYGKWSYFLTTADAENKILHIAYLIRFCKKCNTTELFRYNEHSGFFDKEVAKNEAIEMCNQLNEANEKTTT